MKMYEKLGMSTEAALKWVEECATRNCRECPAYKTQKFGDAATKCACRSLLSDVPKLRKIPRWKTAKTQEDFDELFQHFELDYCANFRPDSCEGCKYYCEGFKNYERWSYVCFCKYLSELVDAPESEVDNGEA